MNLAKRAYEKLKKFFIESKSSSWDVLGQVFDYFNGNSTNVTEASALRLSVVFSCVRVISETVGTLPLNTYKRTEKGKEKAINKNVYFILKEEPNPSTNIVGWKETMTALCALYGNSLSVIQRDDYGRPIAIWQKAPEEWKVIKKHKENKYYYYIWNYNTEAWDPILQENVIHFSGFGGDGVIGFSPIRMNAQSVGMGLASQNLGVEYYENYGFVSDVIYYNGAFKQNEKGENTVVENIRKEWNKNHTGAGKRFKTAIFDEKTKLERLKIPLDDFQFINTHKLTREQICGIFRMPQHMIQSLDNASYNNIESLTLGFTKFTITPWLVRQEKELDRKLFTRRERKTYYTRYNLEMLLRGDPKARSEYYKNLFYTASISPNEIREKEEMNPYEGGYEYYVPTNMTLEPNQNKNQNEPEIK
ncbi:phage portal protein [Flammeovirga sp. OC4]|uniref:phage portal protein n=1 Tax=Flammeovirga sp. OC4 TaxID=1382345 RepID=UPI0005C5933B|nr:phage portal protein [Flammeovirga sp. OC4]